MKTSKVIIVTGAASGIGSAIAKRLANDGSFIIIADIDKEKAAKQVNGLGNSTAKFIYCDISSEESVKDLFKEVIESFGRVDVLINNAGIIKDNLIDKMTLEDFNMVISINLTGTWLMCREASKIMKSQNSGRIINISSRAWLGNAGQSNYSASKAGVIALTRVLALELGKYNVLVNAVAPGLIDTPLTQSLKPEVREKLVQAQPTKQIGKPEDVAETVAFLVDDRTQFINGQTIYVDGGKSVGTAI